MNLDLLFISGMVIGMLVYVGKHAIVYYNIKSISKNEKR